MGKKKGHKRGLLPRTFGGWVSLGFKLMGGAIAISPAIPTVQAAIKTGDFKDAPAGLLYAFTGYNVTNGTVTWTQTGTAVVSVGGGILLAKAGAIIGRMLR